MEVNTIAVISAGAPGRGIALVAALGGYRTILEDISRTTLDQSLAWIQCALHEGVSRREIEAHTRDAAFANIRTACTVDGAIRDADLVIEAVAEEMEMKIELFTLFDKFGKPGAIFASSTSSLSITEMAAMTFSPQRCLGMRFFDPVPKTKLLELSKTQDTSEQTITACHEVARRMGKEVVVIQESPGWLPSDVAQGGNPHLRPYTGPGEPDDRAGSDVRLGAPEYGQSLGQKPGDRPLPKAQVQAGTAGAQD